MVGRGGGGRERGRWWETEKDRDGCNIDVATENIMYVKVVVA